MHHPCTKLAFTCSRISTAHLSALDNMVREAAGADLVVLVKGTLQKSVGIAVCSCIFKVAKTKVTFGKLALDKLHKAVKSGENRVTTVFICSMYSHKSSLAWVSRASESGGICHSSWEKAAFDWEFNWSRNATIMQQEKKETTFKIMCTT